MANLLDTGLSIPRNRVSHEDNHEISSFHPKKPGFLTDVLVPIREALTSE